MRTIEPGNGGFYNLGPSTSWLNDGDYLNQLTNALVFGDPGGFFPDSFSGDSFGFNTIIFLPPGYTGGASIMGSMVFNNNSFTTMGLVSGTSIDMKTASQNDKISIQIGPVSAIPELSSPLALGALFGVAALLRRRKS